MDFKNCDDERGPQWQGRELEVLLEGIEGRYKEIHGKFTSSLSGQGQTLGGDCCRVSCVLL